MLCYGVWLTCCVVLCCFVLCSRELLCVVGAFVVCVRVDVVVLC